MLGTSVEGCGMRRACLEPSVLSGVNPGALSSLIGEKGGSVSSVAQAADASTNQGHPGTNKLFRV